MILFPCQHISVVPIFFAVFRKKLSQKGKGITNLLFPDLHSGPVTDQYG